MEAQRLRNLTTGRLHTEIGHVYEDIEYLTGEPGLFTHQIPNALRALTPWPREKVADQSYWDGEYTPSITGDYDLKPMTEKEKAEYFGRYKELPSSLELLGTGVDPC